MVFSDEDFYTLARLALANNQRDVFHFLRKRYRSVKNELEPELSKQIEKLIIENKQYLNYLNDDPKLRTNHE